MIIIGQKPKPVAATSVVRRGGGRWGGAGHTKNVTICDAGCHKDYERVKSQDDEKNAGRERDSERQRER